MPNNPVYQIPAEHTRRRRERIGDARCGHPVVRGDDLRCSTCNTPWPGWASVCWFCNGWEPPIVIARG